jgi:hypothetical protein
MQKLLCRLLTHKTIHHKLHGPWFNNNSHAKSTFHGFVWNIHGCHSSICIVWTSRCCALFKHKCNMHVCIFSHKCCMSIHVVYTWKLYTQFLCLNNAQHSYLNNKNLRNNKFCTNLEWTHVACKFVMFPWHSKNQATIPIDFIHSSHPLKFSWSTFNFVLERIEIFCGLQ